MEHLDRYEREGIDAEFEDDMDAEAALDARARAERDLDRRDVREGRVTGRRRLPGALEGACLLTRAAPHDLGMVTLNTAQSVANHCRTRRERECHL